MTENIQKVIDDMYENRTGLAYQEFQEIVPKIQSICSIYLEENTSEEALVKVHNLIRNVLHEYEKMDIVELADTLQYDLLDDICYNKGLTERCEYFPKNDIFKINISALKKRNIDVSRIKKEDNNSGTFTERRFISRVSPEKAAQKWKTCVEPIEDYDTLFVFGLSEGSHIRELVKKINDTNHIVIYEPSEKIFMNVVNRFDLSDIIQNKSIELYVENINSVELSSSISSNISYCNRKDIKWYVLPNYDITFTKTMNQYLKSIMTQIRVCDLGRNLVLGEESKMLMNMRHNTFDRIRQYQVSQLKLIEDINPETIPAVLVSAGPSLDKNIEQLKDLDNKMFIVVVDTALKTMVNRGIKFHLGITVDPVKPVSMFENEEICNIPMVMEIHSNEDVVKMHKGKRFYYGNDFLSGYISEKINKWDFQVKQYESICLPSGGSVANDAFSLLVYLGFKTIILVGQDLAFTDDRGHTADAYDTEEDNKKHVQESTTICYVKDIYGNEIKTDILMYSYIDWFESQAKRYKGNIEVIDATEGGAYIAGTKVMTLKEAIDKYCDRTVDIKKIIENIEPTYDEKEIGFLYDALHNLKEDLNPAVELIKGNIKYYKDILNEKVKIKSVLDKINENNVKFQMLPLYPLIVRYSQKIEYEINENVFAKDEDSIEVIAEKYIRLYEGYLESIKRIVEDWSEYEL